VKKSCERTPTFCPRRREMRHLKHFAQLSLVLCACGLLWRVGREQEVRPESVDETAVVTGILGAPEPIVSGEPLPQCSLIFFFHIVKTGGTSMRAVVQRNVQMGDFEYVYAGARGPRPTSASPAHARPPLHPRTKPAALCAGGAKRSAMVSRPRSPPPCLQVARRVRAGG